MSRAWRCRLGYAGVWLVLALTLLLHARAASAHSASTSYLTAGVDGREVHVQWSLALRDLEQAVGLDVNGDGQITWGELAARAPAVEAYALPRLRMRTAGATCVAGPVDQLADELGDGGYAVLRYTLRCPVEVAELDIAYNALFEIDPQHRLLLSVKLGGATHAAVISTEQQQARFGASGGAGTLARQFFVAGVDHLLAGADHMLFILMLLLPALLGAAPAAARSVERPLSRILEGARLLTAFTFAHAITLTLAVLELVQVPTRLAEVGIALTILLTAIDNVRTFLPRRRWTLAFGFGLIHGLGVAGGLGPLHLPPLTLALALVSFNLGLEAAQIGIATLAAPIGHVLRETPAISRRMQPELSAAVGVIALLWIIQRIEPFAPLAGARQLVSLLIDGAHG